jgi:hypothetical protein
MHMIMDIWRPGNRSAKAAKGQTMSIQLKAGMRLTLVATLADLRTLRIHCFIAVATAFA